MTDIDNLTQDDQTTKGDQNELNKSWTETEKKNESTSEMKATPRESK